MITVYPIGTTIYNPEKAFGGYTLLNFLHEPEIVLFDMNGKVVNTWRVERGPKEPAPGSAPLPAHSGPRDDPPGEGQPWSGIWNYVHLLDNGNMLGPREYDWDGDVVWEPPYVPGYTAGLSRRLDNGNTLYSSRREMPEEYKAKVKDPARRRLPGGDRWPPGLQGHSIYETTPSGEVVWEWDAWEHLDVNRYLAIDPSPNWTHFNHLDPLPENRWYDAGDERFRPGNILVSPRTLGFIFIIDKRTKEVVWEHSGSHRGGVAGQHDPRMIPKGLPGAGNILLIDNGQPPVQDIARAGRSSILEIDPVSEEVVWSYEDDGYLTSEDAGYTHNYNEFKFFTAYTGSVQTAAQREHLHRRGSRRAHLRGDRGEGAGVGVRDRAAPVLRDGLPLPVRPLPTARPAGYAERARRGAAAARPHLLRGRRACGAAHHRKLLRRHGGPTVSAASAGQDEDPAATGPRQRRAEYRGLGSRPATSSSSTAR